jgi:hypothetical protein
MLISSILIETVIPWVAEKIFSAYDEKYITPGIKKLLFRPDEYALQLNQVITSTIEKYEKIYPPTGNFPFYHHKETFVQLSKFVLFKDEGNNILHTINFGDLENIEPPTQEQLADFYNFFVTEIQADSKLKEFYIEENYKEKIFEIHRDISLIKHVIEDFIKAIPKSDEVIKIWIEQIYANLQVLKQATALDEINRFEKEALPKIKISDRNKAFMYFVKGLCLNENSKPQEAAAYFEEACALDPENKSFKAWNLYLQYLFNYSPDIISQVILALRDNTFDPILNGILTLENLKMPNFSFKSVSLPVQNNIRYKRIIYLNYLKTGSVDQALNYFAADSTNIKEQLNYVSIDNYHYLHFYLQLCFISLLRNYPNHLFFTLNKSLTQSAELENCISYFTKYLDEIKGSEKKELISLFEYILEIALYFKSSEITYLKNAHHIYQRNQQVITPYYFNLLKWGFSQAGEFEAALSLFDGKEIQPEEYYFKAMLYHRLGREQARQETLAIYLEKVDQIDDLTIDSVIDATTQSSLNPEQMNKFYYRIQNNEIAVNGIYKDIIIAIKGIQQEIHKEESIKILQNNFKKILEDGSSSTELVSSYCRILHAYGEYVGIVELLEKKGVSTFYAKTLLIEALYYSKLNSRRLLKLLEELRETNEHGIDSYYIWEINLKTILELWEDVEVISKRGQILFKNNKAFDFYLAIAYININKKQEFLNLLKSFNILDLEFPNFQVLIQALLKLEESSQAIELAYTYAIKHKEAAHRAFFFNLYMFNYEKSTRTIPELCEPGYFVTIETSTESLTVNNDEHKAVFTKLIGKKTGESILQASAMSSKEIEYTITAIHHKYDILLKEIGKESENPGLTGLPMQSFQLKEGGSVEDLNTQLMDLFGGIGDETNMLYEKTLNQYREGSISFLQLTRQIFNDDIIKAYLQVTHWPQAGFRVIPPSLFDIAETQSTVKPCIDLPTLILFSEISKNRNIEFKAQFIISQHTASYINDLLIASETEKPSEIRLNITSTTVTPSFNEKEKLEYRVNLLKNCKAWMDNNCEIRTSEEKLNIIVRLKAQQGSVNDFVLSYMDTMALTVDHKAILISDEKIAFGAFRESNQIISSEYYLTHFAKNADADLIYDFLSERNYIGIRIPETKIDAIAKMLIEQHPTQENIFQTISIKNSGNSMNIPILILIMKKIIETSISEDQKTDIVQLLFEKLFTGIYDNRNLMQNVIDLVSLSLMRFLYLDKEKLERLKKEFVFVLANNGVRLNFN